MGRNRKKAFQQLPKYVYLERKRYIYNPPDAPRVTLGHIGLSMPDLWEAYKIITGQSDKTLQYLVDQYTKSEHFKKLKSRKAIQAALDRLLAAPINTGTFGQVEHKNITPGVIQRYIDKKNSVAGNREIAYLSSVFKWCRSRDIITGENPCKGVYKIKEKARTRYVNDAEYKAMLDAVPVHIQTAMELAYLCRMRIGEVLDARVSDIEETGLNTRRLKGSDSALTLFTPRLEKAIKRGLKGCLRVPDMTIVNNKGKPLNYNAFRSAWVRGQNKSKQNFRFHDLKAKGISDFEGDKKKAGGHKSEAMTAVYDRKRIEIKGTK